MKRTSLFAAAALIAVATTAVVATAHDRGDRAGPRDGRGGPEMLFERFDTNGDGQVTKAEVAAAAAVHFAETDTNGDGQLSAEELAAAAEARQAARRADRIAHMIERKDTNGDGTLSLEEMSAGRGGEDRLDRMFEHLDTDGDGVITQAEAAQAAAHRGPGHWGQRGGDTEQN